MPGGRTIPSGAAVFAACVRSNDLRQKLYVSDDALVLLSHQLFGSTGEEGGPGTAAGTGCDRSLVELRDAVGLDPGEHYDTCWLHQLREIVFITPPTTVLDIEFAPLIPEPEPPPPLTTEVAAIGEGQIVSNVPLFLLPFYSTLTLFDSV